MAQVVLRKISKVSWFFIVLLIVSCGKDAGTPLPTGPDTSQEQNLELIRQNSPQLNFRHGKNICYGPWIYQSYQECEHPLHGNGPVKSSEINMGEFSPQTPKPHDYCKELATKNVPAGARLVKSVLMQQVQGSYILKYICMAQFEVQGYLKMKSEYCGPAPVLKFQRTPMQASKVPFEVNPGNFDLKCLTCDDIGLDTPNNLRAKSNCFLKNLVALETKTLPVPLEGDEFSKTQGELVVSLRLFTKVYGPYIPVTDKDRLENFLKKYEKMP